MRLLSLSVILCGSAACLILCCQERRCVMPTRNIRMSLSHHSKDFRHHIVTHHHNPKGSHEVLLENHYMYCTTCSKPRVCRGCRPIVGHDDHIGRIIIYAAQPQGGRGVPRGISAGPGRHDGDRPPASPGGLWGGLRRPLSSVSGRKKHACSNVSHVCGVIVMIGFATCMHD